MGNWLGAEFDDNELISYDRTRTAHQDAKIAEKQKRFIEWQRHNYLAVEAASAQGRLDMLKTPGAIMDAILSQIGEEPSGDDWKAEVIEPDEEDVNGSGSTTDDSLL